MKNKQRIESEARYGYKCDDSDEEGKTSNTNHNLIASTTSHRIIGILSQFSFIKLYNIFKIKFDPIEQKILFLFIGSKLLDFINKLYKLMNESLNKI